MRAILLAALVFASPAFALDDPDQLVRALYRPEATPSTQRELGRYFDADLARALWADAQGDEVGAVGFDFRYDAQDFSITGLEFAKTHARSEATVTASFRNFGKPTRMIYRLCIRRPGWRIVDVAPERRDWSLRGLLGLPAHVSCG